MNWEEHLEWLNSSSVEELDVEIAKIIEEQNEAAKTAMNQIHFTLKLAKTSDDILKTVEEIELEYHNTSMHSITSWSLKNRKEKYNKDPEAYEKEWNELQAFAEKLRKEA
jgi:hypothetical protein